jgi:hypothetical protein
MAKKLYHDRPGRPDRGYPTVQKNIHLAVATDEAAKRYMLRKQCSFTLLVERALSHFLKLHGIGIEGPHPEEGGGVVGGPLVTGALPVPGVAWQARGCTVEEAELEEAREWKRMKEQALRKMQAELEEQAREEAKRRRDHAQACVEAQRRKVAEDRRRAEQEEAEAAATEEQARIVASVEMRRRIVEGDEDLL